VLVRLGQQVGGAHEQEEAGVEGKSVQGIRSTRSTISA
jgi:hypothetical protein